MKACIYSTEQTVQSSTALAERYAAVIITALLSAAPASDVTSAPAIDVTSNTFDTEDVAPKLSQSSSTSMNQSSVAVLPVTPDKSDTDDAGSTAPQVAISQDETLRLGREKSIVSAALSKRPVIPIVVGDDGVKGCLYRPKDPDKPAPKLYPIETIDEEMVEAATKSRKSQKRCGQWWKRLIASLPEGPLKRRKLKRDRKREAEIYQEILEYRGLCQAEFMRKYHLLLEYPIAKEVTHL